MRSRVTSFASVFAIVASSFFFGCANDAPEANVLDPGAKQNSPSTGPAGIDGKAKSEGGKAATK